jgi:hypothetical protein
MVINTGIISTDKIKKLARYVEIPEFGTDCLIDDIEGVVWAKTAVNERGNRLHVCFSFDQWARALRKA